MRLSAVYWTLLLLCMAVGSRAHAQGTVSGTLTKWHTVVVDFAGPTTSEADANNPFTDYRLNVTFTHTDSGTTLIVPGFYDGDGNGNGSGNVWRVRFTPELEGEWSYTASFRAGVDVAMSLVANDGSATSFDGATGTFSVGPLDPSAAGFLSRGRLEYNGTHYLKFRDGGCFIKTGADSPENILGYAGFDNTPQAQHTYPTHAGDWNAGDPDWDSPDQAGTTDGRAIIGAFNYLAGVGVNSIYFLPLNVGGDAKDTAPYVSVVSWSGGDGNADNSGNDNSRFDISKLHQWHIALDHAQRKGLYLHFVLNEAEKPNKRELDDATLGRERKLFYREMVARFGHFNALQWNISEEYNFRLDLGEQKVRDFADHIAALDPYDHPITVHNQGNVLTNTWGNFLGETRWGVTSFQQAGVTSTLGLIIEQWRAFTAQAGHPLPIMMDEPGSITRDVSGPDEVRKAMAWDILLSGGGVEWFDNKKDQTLEDFRIHDQVWRETAYARRFLEDNFAFWNMAPGDPLVRGEDTDFGGGEVFAIEGVEYAIYLPDGSNDDNNEGSNTNAPPELDLTNFPGRKFNLRWYNPRTGQFVANAVEITGGSWVSLGATPDGIGNTNDWAASVTIADPDDVELSLAVCIRFTAAAGVGYNIFSINPDGSETIIGVISGDGATATVTDITNKPLAPNKKYVVRAYQK